MRLPPRPRARAAIDAAAQSSTTPTHAAQCTSASAKCFRGSSEMPVSFLDLPTVRCFKGCDLTEVYGSIMTLKYMRVPLISTLFIVITEQKGGKLKMSLFESLVTTVVTSIPSHIMPDVLTEAENKFDFNYNPVADC